MNVGIKFSPYKTKYRRIDTITYLKSLETLRKSLNDPYEVETEKVGGLFDKELQETANVVINKDEFNQFQE